MICFFNQVTFCHTGMNKTDFKTKNFLYTGAMKSWMTSLLDVQQLDAEAAEFEALGGAKKWKQKWDGTIWFFREKRETKATKKCRQNSAKQRAFSMVIFKTKLNRISPMTWTVNYKNKFWLKKSATSSEKGLWKQYSS